MRGELFRLKVRPLATDAELVAFAEGFCRTIERKSKGVVKGNVPLEYLRGARVVGVLDGAGRVLAGYVINTKLPLRLIDFVPPPAREGLKMPEGTSWEDCVEITCAWREPEVSPLFMSLRFWPRAFSEAIATGRRFILGHNQSARLDDLYDDGIRITLYEGPSAIGLPSRLALFETRGLWLRAGPRVVREVVRRALRGARTPRQSP